MLRLVQQQLDSVRLKLPVCSHMVGCESLIVSDYLLNNDCIAHTQVENPADGHLMSAAVVQISAAN